MRYEELPAARAAEVVARGGTLVDVRERNEYHSGTMPDAINIPVGELMARLNELPRNRPVAVFCQTGGRSQGAAAMLASQGFEHVIDLRGGIDAAAQRAA